MRGKSDCFVLTLPLQTEKWQADILDKRMRVNRDIYNAMLKKAYSRYQQMTQTKAWRRTEEALRGQLDGKAGTPEKVQEDAAADRKELYRQRDILIAQYRLRRYDLTKEAARYRQAFPEHTDSPICQNLAENVWRAIDRLVTGKGRQVHFKGPDGLDALSGKSNRASILYRDGYVKWKGLVLKAVSKGNAYEVEALQHEIRYCRIKRREIRGKYRYYVDLVMSGTAPWKHPESMDAIGDVLVRFAPDRRSQGFLVEAVKDTASKSEYDTAGRLTENTAEKLKKAMANNKAKNPAEDQAKKLKKQLEKDMSEKSGIKLRMTRGWGNERSATSKLVPLTAADRHLEQKKREILHFLYHSRKAMNPENYTEDGRICTGAFTWQYSRHYQQERARYRELCRKQRERRRQYQCCLADELLAMGNCFYIEELDYAGMKKRMAYSGPGRMKRYGRRIGVSAPGEFTEILKRKCVQYRKEYKRYSAEDIKAQGMAAGQPDAAQLA